MSLPNAITREDFYLNKIANPSDDHELPDAITRQQHYLKAIAENAGGGGGGSSAVNYSTEEQEVGTWIDGSTLYQKTIDCGNLPNNTTKNVPHLISGITASDIVYIEGVAQYADHYAIPLPKVHDSTASSQVMIEVDATNIILYSRGSNNDSFVGYITLRYIKST